MYVSNGNLKIDKACKVFSLPSSICFGEGNQCKGCYALKSEKRFKETVVNSRNGNLKFTLSDTFILKMNVMLKFTKKRLFRIHESGDFYSQNYVNKWLEIALDNPMINFYGYSKKFDKLDFSKINTLPNVNIINSIPHGMLNYGNLEYCNYLVKKHKFTLCPCGIDEKISCMKDCKLCLTVDRVCFLEH